MGCRSGGPLLLRGHYGGGGSEAFRRSEAALRQARPRIERHMSAAVVCSASSRCGASPGRLRRCPEARDAAPRQAEKPTSRWPTSSATAGCSRIPLASATKPSRGTRPILCSVLARRRSSNSGDTIARSTSSVWTPAPSGPGWSRGGSTSGWGVATMPASSTSAGPGLPSGLVPASFHGLIARCLSGAVPTGAGRLSQDDVRTFLVLRGFRTPLLLRRRPRVLRRLGSGAPAPA